MKSWKDGENTCWSVRDPRSSGTLPGPTQDGNIPTDIITGARKAGGEWEFFDLPEQWNIRYNDLTFNLKPFSFKHTGLFPEQAVNWDWFSEKIRNAGRPVKVLNLFAYTGGATLAAAAAGASVTHVDASKGMVTWAKENAVFFRAEGRSYPLAGRRLCKICGAGDPQGKYL